MSLTSFSLDASSNSRKTGLQRQQPAPCQEPSGSDQPIGETVWRQPVDLLDDSLPSRLVLPSVKEPIIYFLANLRAQLNTHRSGANLVDGKSFRFFWG
ncbi:hypothetical protein CEXT_739121 [Caerostris extrusa]|uniref:Uncharacterized protein n=1 Tax=Caerostris extrusa TaxID=172846 RepID=A0AAV4R7Z7_CAEEX|nr:hypothetical protein CEXT_739121 [Caerostris extrusa]